MEDSSHSKKSTKRKRKYKKDDSDDESDDDFDIDIDDDESCNKMIKVLFNNSSFRQPVLSPNQIYLNSLSKKNKRDLLKMEQKIYNIDSGEIPLRYKILQTNLSDNMKSLLMKKLDMYDTMNSNSSEYHKLTKFFNGLLKIPFGNYVNLGVTKKSSTSKINSFIDKLKIDLDNCVYGNDEAKNTIIRAISKWITNPTSTTNSIGLCGPPGVGKTSLIKNGLSKALNIPFSFVPLGGSTNASVLEGHDYTWEGSKWGKIVDILIENKCMNPIIFFDELDKVSETKAGEEIYSILTHITDTTQNTSFCDKYFNGIDMDLSKCLFIFSFNDETKINPILRDRITMIHLKGFSIDEKIHIAKKFSIPTICKNIGFDITNVNFEDVSLEYIIKNYCPEQGVRKLEKCIEHILLQLNLYHITKNYDNAFNNTEMKLPYKIKINTISNFLTSLFGSISNDTKIHTMYT